MRARGLAAIGCLALLAATPFAAEQAGERTFRDYGRPFVHYATVTRPDGTTRRLFVDEPSARRFAREGFLADRTEILMETLRPGETIPTVEYKRWKQGGWLFSSFRPDAPDWAARPEPVCEACHAAAAKRFEVFTHDSLRRFSTDGVVDRFHCAAPGREPCPESVYAR